MTNAGNNAPADDRPVILAIDDSELVHKALASCLDKERYHLISCKKGADAMETAASHQLDLILLDIVMPDMDGFTVCRMLKQRPDFAGIPVIFLTGLTNSDDIVKGFNAGAVDYVPKPFRGEELLARVETHIALHRARRVLTKQNLALRELTRTRDRLYGVIAHDLRNPMAVIEGFAQQLSGGAGSLTATQASEIASLVRDAARRSLELLGDLQLWAAGQTGTFRAQVETLALSTAVDKEAMYLAPAASRKSILVRNAVPHDLSVLADPRLLATVIRNLLSNAIKFTHAGGRISVEGRQNGDLAECLISDTGIGISQENLARLFRMEEAFSMPGTQQEEGTGLGLILVHDFLERSGGGIRVESVEGRESRFIFTLPRRSNGA